MPLDTKLYPKRFNRVYEPTQKQEGFLFQTPKLKTICGSMKIIASIPPLEPRKVGAPRKNS
ncbi:hypothetical protein METP2_02057 [Methanosarcinales archaeon]|nr:hypothetical protein METP2_02057 [Methanosarcinales archaeon]